MKEASTSSSYDWHRVAIPASTAADRHLERQLGWAADTLAVLHHAFAQQLPRHCDWHAPPTPALTTAARYYKRGVALHGKPPHRSQPHTQLHGVTQLSALRPYLSERLVICDQRLAATLNAPHLLTITATEHHKNLAKVAQLLQRAQGAPPRWTIIGGGLTLDVAAFAAAIAGAEIVLVPTTLLAMIDAAHGGKNGVNFPPWGKNQLGTFHFATEVIICPAWLQTLPRVELQAGGWEGVKHALITGDLPLLQAWLQHLQTPPATWELSLLQKTAAIKTAIVQRDPYEQGERKILNLGHTLAHALEAVAQDNGKQLRHGHAVAVGIAYIIRLSLALQKIDEFPLLTALSAALPTHAQLTATLGDLHTAQLWTKIQHYIAQDKKRRGDACWILLQAATPLPRAHATPQAVDSATLQKVWQQLLGAV